VNKRRFFHLPTAGYNTIINNDCRRNSGCRGPRPTRARHELADHADCGLPKPIADCGLIANSRTMCRDPISDPQGGPGALDRHWTFFSVPWGARWTPPRPQVPSDVIKRAHPTRNSAGSSVGSLAAPRATPRLGGVYVLCLQYFPCSFMYSPCASSAFDWGSKPDSRSAPAPAPVESPPGLVLLPVAVIGFRAVGISRLEAPNRDPGLCTASQPCAESAARSGPRFVAPWFLLLAGYENLTAPNAIMQS
jgi:hypothetical protein